MKSDLQFRGDLEMQSASMGRLKTPANQFLRLMILFLASVGIIFCVILFQHFKIETYDKINYTLDLLTLHKRLSEKSHGKRSIPVAAQLLQGNSRSKAGLQHPSPVLQLETFVASDQHINGRSSVFDVKNMMHRRGLSVLYPQEPNIQIPTLESDVGSTEATAITYVIPEINPIVNIDNSSIELMTDITLSDAPIATAKMIDQLPTVLNSAHQHVSEVKDATSVEEAEGMSTVLALNAQTDGVQQQELSLDHIDHQIPTLESDVGSTEATAITYVIPEINPIVNIDNSSIELMTDITLSDAPIATAKMIDQLPTVLNSAHQHVSEVKDATSVEEAEGMSTVLVLNAQTDGVQQQSLQNTDHLSPVLTTVPPLQITFGILNDVALQFLEV